MEKGATAKECGPPLETNNYNNQLLYNLKHFYFKTYVDNSQD